MSRASLRSQLSWRRASCSTQPESNTGRCLQREMRFTALAVINTVGLIVGTAIAIAGAKVGYGYWALVAMTVTVPLITRSVSGSPPHGFRECRNGGLESVP